MKDTLLFWPYFIKEAYISRKYFNAVKGIEKELNAANLRVDWIGRIYGVMSIKEEFMNQPELVQQSIVFQQLAPVNDLLIKYGLSDLSFPEISKIKGTEQFLVVLYPENDYFNIEAFFRNLLVLGMFSGGLIFLNYIFNII
jgi:hypothetical protein